MKYDLQKSSTVDRALSMSLIPTIAVGDTIPFTKSHAVSNPSVDTGLTFSSPEFLRTTCFSKSHADFNPSVDVGLTLSVAEFLCNRFSSPPKFLALEASWRIDVARIFGIASINTPQSLSISSGLLLLDWPSRRRKSARKRLKGPLGVAMPCVWSRQRCKCTDSSRSSASISPPFASSTNAQLANEIVKSCNRVFLGGTFTALFLQNANARALAKPQTLKP